MVPPAQIRRGRIKDMKYRCYRKSTTTKALQTTKRLIDPIGFSLVRLSAFTAHSHKEDGTGFYCFYSGEGLTTEEELKYFMLEMAGYRQ